MLLSVIISLLYVPQNVDHNTIKIESRIKGKQIAIHQFKTSKTENGTVLFLHGSSFPSKLSFSFKLGAESWVDYLLEKGYTVYALDFLGYGDSDRYDSMIQKNKSLSPRGSAKETLPDLIKTVDYILKSDGNAKLHIIAHSWGTLVAGLFAEEYSDKIHTLTLYASLSPKHTNKINESSSIPAFKSIDVNNRVQQMNSSAPENIRPLLAPQMFTSWGNMWLNSDQLREKNTVFYPSGSILDVLSLQQGAYIYQPEKIRCDVLIIRGEYDTFPAHNEAYQLFTHMKNASSKTYITLDKGTHVMHLEKNRKRLYDTVYDFIENK